MNNTNLVDLLLVCLTPREEQIVRLRYALGEKRTHTIREIAQRFATSPAGVGQSLFKANMKLLMALPRMGAEYKPYGISSWRGGRCSRGRVDLFSTLQEASQYIRDNWRDMECVQYPTRFHLHGRTFKLHGFRLCHYRNAERRLPEHLVFEEWTATDPPTSHLAVTTEELR